jgi:hypothetical protein
MMDDEELHAEDEVLPEPNFACRYLTTAALAELDDTMVLRTLPDSFKDLVRERVKYGTSLTLFCPFLLPIADISHMVEFLPRDQVFNSAPRDMDLF